MHTQNQREEHIKMVEIILAGLVGILIGIGGTKALNRPPQTEDKTSQGQQEVIKQLTDLDVVKELCTPENTASEQGMLLCREMTCLVYSRGIDSQTGGKQCEEISNIQNTISMIEYCKEQGETGSLCHELFWRRK